LKEQTLTLADGRTLGYAEWGPHDAPPVIYCHGFPTNHKELEPMLPVLERNAIEARIIVLNRPGFGSSTFQAGRTFLDWPRDVAEAADLLGVGRFAVLGVSGGGPYALATASVLGERVTRVGLAVGLAPIEAPGMRSASAISGPSGIGLIRRVQFEMTALAFKKGQEDRFLDQSLSTMGEVDRTAMTAPEMRSWMTEMMRESFRQGGKAAALEAGLYRRPWGFDPKQVQAETRLWYGGADKTVPAESGRWLADRLPHSDFVLWPEHGHFTWMLGHAAADVVQVLA